MTKLIFKNVQCSEIPEEHSLKLLLNLSYPNQNVKDKNNIRTNNDVNVGRGNFTQCW